MQQFGASAFHTVVT